MSFVQTDQIAVLGAQENGPRIGPRFKLRIVKSIGLPPRTSNDIALIKLCEEAGSSSVIAPIGLPEPHLNLSNIDDVTVAGWGTTEECGSVSRNEC